jgi:large subunit ribosomal protein L35
MGAGKMKTKKAVAKRFRANGSGQLLRGAARMRHNLRRRTKDAKRQDRRGIAAHSSHARLLRRCLPYGLE